MNAQGRWIAATIVALSVEASAQVVLIDAPGEGPDWQTAGSVDNPPDCWIAVGEDVFDEGEGLFGVFGVVVNHHMAFYKRTPQAPLHDENGLNTFFDIGNSGYDPRIIWDHYTSRFVTTILGQGSLWMGWSAAGDVSPIGVAGQGASVWESEMLAPISIAECSCLASRPTRRGW